MATAQRSPYSQLVPLNCPYMPFGVSSRQPGGQNWPQMSTVKLIRARPNAPPIVSPHTSFPFSSISLSLSSSLSLYLASYRFAIVSSAEYTPSNKSIHEPPSRCRDHQPPTPAVLCCLRAVVTEIRFTFTHVVRFSDLSLDSTCPRVAFLLADGGSRHLVP